MNSRHLTMLWLLGLILVVAPMSWADDEFPDNDPILHALVDELEHSMKMQLEDLEKPYLIQFAVEDAVRHQMSANYGAIVSSNRSQSRTFQSRVRVGSYELDNTNFSGGGGFRRGRGGRAQLPIDDDYIALRKAIWLATDRDYKSAVETLTQKRAYMKDKNLEERPDDYSKVEPTRWFEPEATLEVDQEQWKEYLRQVSGRFMKHEYIQNSSADLSTIASNKYVVTSEGTRLRHTRIRVLLRLSAQVQTDDGERFSDVREFIVENPGDLPALTEGFAAVDDLADGLHRAMQSAVLDEYTGPVLFDGLASAQMFQSLMAAGVAGRPESVGSGRRRFGGTRSLDRFIGRRILPASFQVYDDPRETTFDDQSLYGHYRFDDEGV